MRPTVLIVEDSPSTADLARLALAEVTCEVEVAPSAPRALELLEHLYPSLMVVDTHLPGVPFAGFLLTLRQTLPRTPMILLLDHGVHVPPVPLVSAQLLKPLQPRRLRAVVTELIDRCGPADA